MSDSLQERLDRALLECLSEFADEDFDQLRVEVVAASAGVSRATAYRHYGGREGMVSRATTLLTQRHAQAAAEILDRIPTVAGRVEEGFAYAAREIRNDRMLGLLLRSRPSAGIEGVLRSVGQGIGGESMRAGRLNGQLRNDLTSEEIVDWILAQHHVAARLGLDEQAAREWACRFVLPAIQPRPTIRLTPEASETFADLQQRVDALSAVVHGVGAVA